MPLVALPLLSLCLVKALPLLSLCLVVALQLLSLCLLAQAYEQAYNLLQIFAELEMTVNMLIQIDKLVQLLESPVFTYLRMQLLEPDQWREGLELTRGASGEARRRGHQTGCFGHAQV